MGILAWIVVGLNCGFACGHGDEGRRLRRLDFRRWESGMAGKRLDRSLLLSFAQESLMGTPGPIVRVVWASGSSPINASLRAERIPLSTTARVNSW